MLPETEDFVVDFNWIDIKMQHQEKVSSSASENSDRKKELLQKLYRSKNPLTTSIPALPQPYLSGIRRRDIGVHEDSVTRETDDASVGEVGSKFNCFGGEGSEPDLSDIEVTLQRFCVSHPTNKTKYFRNDCKLFVCIKCIAFGVHKPHQVSNEEDSRYFQVENTYIYLTHPFLSNLRGIIRQMITEKRKEHSVKELQRILEEQRGEHIEQFETLLMETTNHIRILQEKSLDSWVRHSNSNCLISSTFLIPRTLRLKLLLETLRN